MSAAPLTSREPAHTQPFNPEQRQHMNSALKVVVDGNTAHFGDDGVDHAMAFWSYDDPGAVRGGSVEIQDGRLVAHGPDRGAQYDGPAATRSARTLPSNPVVLTEARDDAGRKVFGKDISHKHIVQLRSGVETSLGAALHTGEVVQMPDGSYALAGGGQQASRAASDDREKEPEPSREVQLGAETDALIVELAQGVPATDAAQLIGDACSGREFDEAALSRAASNLGVEPEAFVQKADQVRDAYEQAALASVSGYGVDPYDIMAFGYEHMPDEMNAAIRRLIAGDRRTDSFPAIAEQYFENLDKIDPDALLDAEFGPGVEIYRGQNGKIMVRVEGRGETSYGVAVRAGWLGFSAIQ